MRYIDGSYDLDLAIDSLVSNVETPMHIRDALEAAAEILAEVKVRGAGGVFVARDTGRILLNKRSILESHPHTWGTWGGGLDEGETPEQAMKREVGEEAGYHGPMKVKHLWTYQDPTHEFFNFIIEVPHEFTPHLSKESEDAMWTTTSDLPSPLHHGLKGFLPHLIPVLKSYQ